MSPDHVSSSFGQPRRYCITIQGHLHPRWSEWFENLTISQQPDGTTTLSGPVADQAALYGLILKLRDMGLSLLAIESLAADQGKHGIGRGNQEGEVTE